MEIKNNHQKSKNKHQNLVNLIANQLKTKPYVDWVRTNVEYEHGECDILAKQGNKLVYYEIKSNHTKKGYEKAQKQLNRWSDYYKNENTRGVYVSPQYMRLII